MWFLLYREVNGDEKREFKEIRKVSKVCQLKISHSASSLILKLDIQLQRSVRLSTSQIFSFLCFLLPNQVVQQRWSSLEGLCSTGGSRGGGLGGCVVVWGGVGARGWRHPPNPGHATKRLPRCPKAHQQIHHLIRQFVTNSRVAFDAFKASGCLRCRQF